MSSAKQVGILAAEVYFPRHFVDQKDLEKFDGVSDGKYTIGLGQDNMGIVSDREDVNSIALTALDKLIKSFSIDLSKIGRLEVGTETMVDKSKSVKSYLMQRFEEAENFDLEGVDNKNACYGGTAALFNTVNWVESSSWDGRCGIVVMADIAIYGKGPARPTGGVGAVALLIGPNAPLEIKPTKQHYMRHTYDFYKPDLTSEYPVVDGPLSITCYFEALDRCYSGWRQKVKKNSPNSTYCCLENLDYVCFHAPFAKLVEKSFARLLFGDLRSCPEELSKKLGQEGFDALEKYKDISTADSLKDKTLEKTLTTVAKPLFKSKCLPSLKISKNVGNMYTPSLYGCILSLLSTGKLTGGEKIGCFSYGSGLSASFYTIEVHGGEKLDKLNKVTSLIDERLNGRTKITCEELVNFAGLREAANKTTSEQLKNESFKPAGPVDSLESGTVYLEQIDSKWRRHYSTA